MDKKKMEALARKNMAKETKEKDARRDQRRQYDDTLPPDDQATGESRAIFNAMKGKRKHAG